MCDLERRRESSASWPAAAQGPRFGGREREIVLRAATSATTHSRGAGQLAGRRIGTEQQRERSERLGQEPCADRPRGQTRPPRPRRWCRCRRRARSRASLTRDAGTLSKWRRDTRPCTTGRRSAPLPNSARPRKELLETRDARDLQGQEPRQPGKDATVQNPCVFEGLSRPGGVTCGISLAGADNSPPQSLCSEARVRLSWDQSWPDSCSLRDARAKSEIRALRHGSLADRAVRSDAESETRFVAVARRGGVLGQPDVIHQHISRHRSSRILIARVLIVHSKGHGCVDRHVRERNLVSIWRHRLQGDARETAPARMRVSRADTVDARLRRTPGGQFVGLSRPGTRCGRLVWIPLKASEPMDGWARHSPASRGSAPPRRPARAYEQHTDKSTARLESVCVRSALSLKRGHGIEPSSCRDSAREPLGISASVSTALAPGHDRMPSGCIVQPPFSPPAARNPA